MLSEAYKSIDRVVTGSESAFGTALFFIYLFFFFLERVLCIYI